jgi:hypothetical protein
MQRTLRNAVFIVASGLFAAACGGDGTKVTGLDPGVGGMQGEQPIRITGANFRTDIGYTVYFGARRATKVTILDPSTLVAMSPPSSEPATVDIAVRGDDGLAVRMPQAFRYENMAGNVVEQLGESQQKNQGNLAY